VVNEINNRNAVVFLSPDTAVWRDNVEFRDSGNVKPKFICETHWSSYRPSHCPAFLKRCVDAAFTAHYRKQRPLCCCKVMSSPEHESRHLSYCVFAFVITRNSRVALRRGPMNSIWQLRVSSENTMKNWISLLDSQNFNEIIHSRAPKLELTNNNSQRKFLNVGGCKDRFVCFFG
jgi:hypothetical protein